MLKNHPEKEGDFCLHCLAPVRLKSRHGVVPEKKKHEYYYEAWFVCTNPLCKALWMHPKYKRRHPDSPAFSNLFQAALAVSNQNRKNNTVSDEATQWKFGEEGRAQTGEPPW